MTYPVPASGDPRTAIPHSCDVLVARSEQAQSVDRTPTPGPTRGSPGRRNRTSRLTGVHAARGIPLFDMFAVHVLPTVHSDRSESYSHALAGGKSAALAVRAAAIGLIGFTLGYSSFDTVGVILAFYAVIFLWAIPLIGLSARALLALAFAIAIVVAVLSHVVRAGVPSPSLENPSFGHLTRDPISQALALTVTGLYPALPWMAYIGAGLAVSRMALSSLCVAAGLLTGGGVLAFAASLISWALLHPLGGLARISELSEELSRREIIGILREGYGATPTTTFWWLAVDSPHTTTPLDLLHTTGVAFAVLGFMLLFARGARPLLAPLAAAGGMTLTLYSAHVVLLTSPPLSANVLVSFLLHVALALAFAIAWRRRRGRGPLEGLVAAWAGRTSQRVLAKSEALPGRDGSLSGRRGGLVLGTSCAVVAGVLAPAGLRLGDGSVTQRTPVPMPEREWVESLPRIAPSTPPRGRRAKPSPRHKRHSRRPVFVAPNLRSAGGSQTSVVWATPGPARARQVAVKVSSARRRSAVRVTRRRHRNLHPRPPSHPPKAPPAPAPPPLPPHRRQEEPPPAEPTPEEPDPPRGE